MFDLSKHFYYVLIMSKLKYEQNLRYLSRKNRELKETNKNQTKWCQRFTVFITCLAGFLVTVMINRTID